METTGLTRKISVGLMWCIFVYHFLYAIDFFSRIGLDIHPMPLNALCLLLTFGLVLVLGSAKGVRRKIPWYDLVMLLGMLLATLYIIIEEDSYLGRLGICVSTLEVVLGLIAILVTFEVTRRVSDLSYVIVGAVFVLYAAFGNYVPGFFRSSGSNFFELTGQIWLSNAGLLGNMSGVVLDYLFPFLLFTSILQHLGGALFLQRLAFRLFGRTQGSSAKVAIALNFFMAMINGSAVANVIMTTPLAGPKMVEQGYSKAYTGGLISVAATASQLTPPVMGLVAFVMADMLSIPYIKLCFFAMIPAFLYYFSLFLLCHMEAMLKKLGPVEMEAPPLGLIFKEGWPHLVGIGVLIVLLASGKFTARLSVVLACVTLVLFGVFQEQSRITRAKLMDITEDMASLMAAVAPICASAGIIVASIGLSSLDFKLSTELVSMVGEQLLPLLGIAAIVCLILGMGMPTLPAYILVVLIVTPGILKLGIAPLVLHMFVFYWGLAAMITPPVCGAVFVAAPMVGAGVWKVGGQAVRLGIATYIIPFIFVYRPALLLVEGSTLLEQITAIFIGIVATTGLCLGVGGYGLRKLAWAERVIAPIGACLLIFTSSWMLALGAGLLITVAICQVTKFVRARRNAQDITKPQIEWV